MNERNRKKTLKFENKHGLEKIKGIEGAYVPYVVMCSECQHDENIEHSRDSDARCLICGAFLCGGHIMKHLKEEHCVGTHLYKKDDGNE